MTNEIFKKVLSELDKIEEQNSDKKEITQAINNIRKLLT